MRAEETGEGIKGGGKEERERQRGHEREKKEGNIEKERNGVQEK